MRDVRVEGISQQKQMPVAKFNFGHSYQRGIFSLSGVDLKPQSPTCLVKLEPEKPFPINTKPHPANLTSTLKVRLCPPHWKEISAVPRS